MSRTEWTVDWIIISVWVVTLVVLGLIVWGVYEVGSFILEHGLGNILKDIWYGKGG